MNTSTGDNFLSNVGRSKTIKIVLLILIIVSIVANGVQGYFLVKQAKEYKNLKAIVNSKSNCDECPEQVEATPEPTPTSTTPSSRGSGSSSDTDADTSQDTVATPEPVIPPPPPPAD